MADQDLQRYKHVDDSYCICVRPLQTYAPPAKDGQRCFGCLHPRAEARFGYGYTAYDCCSRCGKARRRLEQRCQYCIGGRREENVDRTRQELVWCHSGRHEVERWRFMDTNTNTNTNRTETPLACNEHRRPNEPRRTVVSPPQTRAWSIQDAADMINACEIQALRQVVSELSLFSSSLSARIVHALALRSPSHHPVTSIDQQQLELLLDTNTSDALRNVIVGICESSPALSGAVVRGLLSYAQRRGGS